MDGSSIQTLPRDRDRRDGNFSAKLAGDLAAAALSATLVSPAVTIIDRALVEKASSQQPLLNGLRSHARAALRHPHRFVVSRPYGYVWTLYAATYSVANSTETVAKSLYPASSAEAWTFLCTFLVNVPLGVWKDIRFAHFFRRASRLDPALNAVSLRGSARATAVLLLRDAVTIFGSFTLAQRCLEAIPDYLASHPSSTLAVTQIVVPVLSQLVATPLHLLGLNLYNHQHAVPWSDRIAAVWRDLPPATLVRCVRIIPAFGVGCLANMSFRSYFDSHPHI